MTESAQQSKPDFAVYPEDLASAGRRIQFSVADLPAALGRFARDGFANPSEFGSTTQDQQMGRDYQALCDAVQELIPMTEDGIHSLGAAVARWAEIFADQDSATARRIADQPNVPR